MHVNFISSRDTGKTPEIMQGKDTNAITRDIYRSFLHNYQQELKLLKEVILYLKVLIY